MGLPSFSVTRITRRRRITRRLLTILTAGLLTLPLPSLLQINVFEPATATGAPQITSVSPDSGPTEGGHTVTINGSNFSQLTDRITSIAAGMEHSCAVANGKAYCWGVNGSGQLGNGTTTTSTVPIPVNTSGVLAGKTVTSISTSPNHTCAVADARAYCWGSNTDGKLGNGNTTPSSVPVAVNTSGVLAGKTVTAIDTGLAHTCAVASTKAYCWGENTSGNLGNSTTTSSTTPVAVSTTGALAGKNVTFIATGQLVTCAVADSKAYCWGDGVHGHLGTGNSETTSSPLPVLDTGVLAGKTVTEVHSESQHVCALANNAAYCWGFGMVGQFGNGTYDYGSPVPVAANPIGTLTSLATGYGHTCAIRDHTSIYCWGANYSGAIGNGTSGNEINTPTMTSRTNIPVQPTVLPSVDFGEATATSVNFISSSQLTAITPAHSAGSVAITVTNPSGQSSTLPDAYTYIAPVTAPGPPTSLTTTPASAGVQLHWSAPADTGGAPIIDYLVEYRSDDSSTWHTFSHPPSSATTLAVTGLLPSATYTFRVSATNSAGTGAPSVTVAGTPIYITVSSPPSTSLHVTPAAGSRTSSTSHSVVTSTNAPDGYTLSVSMEGASSTLTSNGQTIAATSGTTLSPAALDLNSWGFRVANIGNFGPGGAPESGVEDSTYTWAGVPRADSPATIRTTSDPSQNDTTTIWYGVRIDTQKPSGTYSGSIMYTAVAN